MISKTEDKASQEKKGEDSEGKEYKTIQDMWKHEIIDTKGYSEEYKSAFNVIGSKKNWYKKANDYWTEQEASVSGVLGGFPEIDDPDIAHSAEILQIYLGARIITNERAIDCGAGIGRIAQRLLFPNFQNIDILEQCEKFVEKAKTLLTEKNFANFYCKGLQEFEFEHSYSCIWIQWVLSHLTDDDALQFLNKCKKNLLSRGLIFVKENVEDEGFYLDKEDYSVTSEMDNLTSAGTQNIFRSIPMFEDLFEKAGFNIIENNRQEDYPQDLYSLHCFVLQDKEHLKKDTETIKKINEAMKDLEKLAAELGLNDVPLD